MGLFSKLKNKLSKNHATPPTPTTNNNIENESVSQDTNSNTENNFKNFSNKSKELKEKKERETFIIDSLKPYRCIQKILIWNDGFKTVIYGYPVALIPMNDDYIILYRKRGLDWIDELIIKLKSIIFGYKENYRILRVPKYCVSLSNEIIEFFAQTIYHKNESGKFVEYVVPIEGNDPLKRIFWEIEREKATAYRRALYTILHNELPEIIDRTLRLNPSYRAYQGLEASKKGRGETKSRLFSGVDVGFDIFDELERQLKGGFKDE